MQGDSLLESYKQYDLRRLCDGVISDMNGQHILNADNQKNKREKENAARTHTNQLMNQVHGYFSPDPKYKGEERKKILDRVKDLLDLATLNLNEDDRTELYEIQWDGNSKLFLWHLWFKEVFDKGGFDIVIGNPPYVSNKGSSTEYKSILKSEYGFADDLYMHFFFQGYQKLKPFGVLSFITSNTYWTIQTKAALRELLLTKTSILNINNIGFNAFKAMVGTDIMTTVKTVPKAGNPIIFINRSHNWNESEVIHCQQELYLEAHNHVIFCPNELNLKLFKKFNAMVKILYDKWWDKIKSSNNISRNAAALEKYRTSLKPGDITLIGMVTDGGQGLATANNGKYIAVLDGTRFADNIRKTRPKKLDMVIKKYNLKLYDTGKFSSTKDYLSSLSEPEIVGLFDKLKEDYGRDIFGQGYLFRIIKESELIDIDSLTDDEKTNGIEPPKNTYVPYDKGDQDGNRWYIRTPYAIDWSRDNVSFLKTNSGKKGKGMPVVRNAHFYFKEGFCWNNVLQPDDHQLLKVRLKSKSVHDVASMTLHAVLSELPDQFIVCFLNSQIAHHYFRTFINNTVNIQINDIRNMPIVCPKSEILLECFNLINGYTQSAIDLNTVDEKSNNLVATILDIVN